VVLNDVSLFGDDKAGDGLYAGLLRADAGLMEAEAGRYLERVRMRQWLAVANNVPHGDGVAVPSFPVPARPARLSAIHTLQPGWNPANPATLNLNRLPFRLLALVNRIDLAQAGYASTGSPGELRFVAGA
jgi:hypothetical protein